MGDEVARMRCIAAQNTKEAPLLLGVSVQSSALHLRKFASQTSKAFSSGRRWATHIRRYKNTVLYIIIVYNFLRIKYSVFIDK